MPSRAEVRRFFLTGGLMVAVVWGIWLPWLQGQPPRMGVMIVAGAVAFAGVCWPDSLRGVARTGMSALAIIGRLNGAILLTTLFCLIIVPTALLMRLLGKRAPEDRVASHYTAPPERRPADMSRMF